MQGPSTLEHGLLLHDSPCYLAQVVWSEHSLLLHDSPLRRLLLDVRVLDPIWTKGLLQGRCKLLVVIPDGLPSPKLGNWCLYHSILGRAFLPSPLCYSLDEQFDGAKRAAARVGQRPNNI